MLEVQTIQSVSQFVEVIASGDTDRRERLDGNVSSGTFYRGQSDVSWLLSPSLYRTGLFSQERALIAEIQRIRPEEFEGGSRFDRLVKMQHYGLPTRLLDVTTNPLVALYFACEDTEKDGSVFMFRNLPVFWQQNYAVRLMMLYSFEFAGPRVDIGRFLEAALRDPIVSAHFSDSNRLAETATHYLTKVPVMAVRPSLSNQRIARQQGAFLVFGMTLGERSVSTNPGTAGRVYFDLRPIPATRNPEDLWHASVEYRIPAANKKVMRETLRHLGVTRSQLFPELEHQAAFVRDTVVAQSLKAVSVDEKNGE